jgi:hypothetical protein
MSPRTDPATGQSSGDDESHSERVNRELIELLNELRVALPGVQVLFAFLLAVPFAQGFTTTTDFQRDLFFGTLLATAISSALLIAPSAYHRINFREKDKERMLLTSNALIYGPAVPVICAIAGVALFTTLWFVVPIVRRNPDDRPSRK